MLAAKCEGAAWGRCYAWCCGDGDIICFRLPIERGEETVSCVSSALAYHRVTTFTSIACLLSLAWEK